MFLIKYNIGDPLPDKLLVATDSKESGDLELKHQEPDSVSCVGTIGQGGNVHKVENSLATYIPQW